MLNRHGAVIGESPKAETKIFSKQTAWYMTKMLEGVVKEGTAKAGVYNGALAGKTGTTSLPNDDNGERYVVRGLYAKFSRRCLDWL